MKQPDGSYVFDLGTPIRSGGKLELQLVGWVLARKDGTPIWYAPGCIFWPTQQQAEEASRRDLSAGPPVALYRPIVNEPPALDALALVKNIAERGPVPDEAGRVRCQQCGHAWAVIGDKPHHAPDCAYIGARRALALDDDEPAKSVVGAGAQRRSPGQPGALLR